MDVKALISEENIIKWRRHIHENPELGFQEVETSKYIYEILESFDTYKLEKLTPTSVVATLATGKPGKTIAIRADIDALPILEETDIDFKSKNDGVMHACGHDSHAAMLLGAAEAVAKIKDELTGTIKFIFQHAEELPPGGAQELVAAGVMDGVDHIFGAHIAPGMPAGAIGYRYGVMNAAGDIFELTIKGRGAHAAEPHTSIDPILIGSEIINALHHAVARNFDPFANAVITIGEFRSGHAANIIPDTAWIQGTARTNTKADRDIAEERITKIINNIIEMHGATADFKYLRGYDLVTNATEEMDYVLAAARKVVGEAMIFETPAIMAGEDFSAYLTKAPGAFFNVGVGDDASQGYGVSVHNPKFKLEEAGLFNGAAMHVQLVLDLLGK